MTQIHPTAVVDPAARLHESVVVGPYTIVGPHVEIGAGTTIPEPDTANGEVAWNAEVISLDELQTRLNEAGQAEQKPTVQLRADKEARYDTVAQVMSRASEAGLSDIAFLSDN